jgi:hypothetical protein
MSNYCYQTLIPNTGVQVPVLTYMCSTVQRVKAGGEREC